jgi:outer membrane cobalamin receptor
MNKAELLNIRIISASVTDERYIDAASNVLVVTGEMIRRRGYRNLVDLLQDLPGFDFAMYHESGESPTSSSVRGIGEKDGDNPKLLMMTDGVPQNNISINSALTLSHEQLLHDVERVEIILGPGSSIHGAQAYAGVINVVTVKKKSGLELGVLAGRHDSQEWTFHYGKQVQPDLFVSLAVKAFQSDGDNGVGRPDPGGYFSDLPEPVTLTQQYDAAGQYLENIPNPAAGAQMADGYNNRFDTLSVRAKAVMPANQAQLFYWDDEHGISSSFTGFEYRTADAKFMAHRRGLHFFWENEQPLAEQWLLTSRLTYRESQVMPDTGFEYSYRFPGLRKLASSTSTQTSLEERLQYRYAEDGSLIVGYRGMRSHKGEYFYSLGTEQDIDTSVATSSWDLAVAGQGLNQSAPIRQVQVLEQALYALWKQDWTERHTTSIGLRHDNSEEYGIVNTPRLAYIFRPGQPWVLKALYGTAFRQPAFSELYMEGFGNPQLTPETVSTWELELNYIAASAHLRTNVFRSSEQDAIAQVTNPNPDPNSFTDQIFDNVERDTKTAGLSQLVTVRLGELDVYGNYMFTRGKRDESWGDIERIARHKFNLGVSWLITPDWDLNLRFNYVGKRKAQATNRWLLAYEDGYAPAYHKTNLVLTWQGVDWIELQLQVNNLFDQAYYGIGRRSGDSFRDDYDPDSQVNPPGFIPPYHPQPGREIFCQFRLKFD